MTIHARRMGALESSPPRMVTGFPPPTRPRFSGRSATGGMTTGVFTPSVKNKEPPFIPPAAPLKPAAPPGKKEEEKSETLFLLVIFLVCGRRFYLGTVDGLRV